MENKDLIYKNRFQYMKLAVKEAKKAFSKEEVPVGCVIISTNGVILAKSYNKVEEKNNPTLHAEMVAINKAVKKYGEKYLMNASIFITLEPCPMCAVAISLAKIKNIYFGASDEKGGAIKNGVKIFENSQNLFKPNIYSGIMEQEASDLLKEFFHILRNKKKGRDN